MSIETAVAELPTDLAGLVAFLVEKGYRGIPGDPTCDPVGRYISDTCGMASPKQGGVALLKKWDDETETFRYAAHYVWMPAVVAEFVPLFDAGEYPELIEDYTYRWMI